MGGSLCLPSFLQIIKRALENKAKLIIFTFKIVKYSNITNSEVMPTASTSGSALRHYISNTRPWKEQSKAWRCLSMLKNYLGIFLAKMEHKFQAKTWGF